MQEQRSVGSYSIKVLELVREEPWALHWTWSAVRDSEKGFQVYNCWLAFPNIFKVWKIEIMYNILLQTLESKLLKRSPFSYVSLLNWWINKLLLFPHFFLDKVLSIKDTYFPKTLNFIPSQQWKLKVHAQYILLS